MEAIITPSFGSPLSLGSRTNPISRTKLNSFSQKTSYHGKLVHYKTRASLTTTCHDDDQQSSNPTFKKLSPSEWGHYFLDVSIDVSEMNAIGRDIETLKPKVREILMMPHHSQSIEASKTRIVFIYLLVSLGLAYLFEEEIEESLEQDFQKVDDMMIGENDLYKVSIIFWVFRTYGHNMSSDVFKRFQENNGNFKESLVMNVKGMISLYEAAHLWTRTDHILDEALSFASNHLESLHALGTLPSHISRYIQKTLYISQHRNMEILVAVEFIKFYEKEDDHDDMLLKLSKLNFKFQQLHYLQEIKVLTKWYKDLDFASNLPPYFRDRIVEIYFFAPGAYIEPESARARIMFAKFYAVITLLDDTCDRYASIPEAESLANSLERWNLDDVIAMDKLEPSYLNFVYKFITETFKEFGREVVLESLKATKEEFQKIVKANLQHAKWSKTGHMPSFEEYMKIGEVEITIYATMAAIFMNTKHINAHETYEWLKSRPTLVRQLARKTRLMNDLTGFKDDMNRGYVATGVNCYMKQHGVTEEEAIREMWKMVKETDKIMNEEFLMKEMVSVPRRVWKAVIDLARTVNISYNETDEYTDPNIMKEYVTSLFIDQIHL
ncbi:unnamed protein product [Cochlearia groenlandica]